MRILNQDDDNPIKNVLLLLTIEEATELRDDLERLISEKTPNDHSHINDLEYEHELSVSVYNSKNVNGFHDRVKKLILFNN